MILDSDITWNVPVFHWLRSTVLSCFSDVASLTLCLSWVLFFRLLFRYWGFPRVLSPGPFSPYSSLLDNFIHEGSVYRHTLMCAHVLHMYLQPWSEAQDPEGLVAPWHLRLDGLSPVSAQTQHVQKQTPPPPSCHCDWHCPPPVTHVCGLVLPLGPPSPFPTPKPVLYTSCALKSPFLPWLLVCLLI